MKRVDYCHGYGNPFSIRVMMLRICKVDHAKAHTRMHTQRVYSGLKHTHPTMEHT